MFCLLHVANPQNTSAEGQGPAQLLLHWPSAEPQLETQRSPPEL